MAGKKKKSGSKKNKNPPQEKTPWDDLSKERLEETIEGLQCQLEKARELRIRNQNEFDQAQELYNKVNDDINKKEIEIYLKANEIETKEKQHKVEARVFELKRKHIEYKHQNEIHDLKNATSKILEKQELQLTLRNKYIRIQESILRDDIHERGLVFCEDVKRLRRRFQDEIECIRQQEMEKQSKKEADLAEIFEKTRMQLEDSLKSILQSYEEKKNQHLSAMRSNHKDSIESMKDYYKTVMDNYANSIDGLNDEVSSKQSQISTLENDIRILQEQNDTLSQPLEEARKLIQDLKYVQLKHADKDLSSLQSTQRRLDNARKEYQALLVQVQSQADVETTSNE